MLHSQDVQKPQHLWQADQVIKHFLHIKKKKTKPSKTQLEALL